MSRVLDNVNNIKKASGELYSELVKGGLSGEDTLVAMEHLYGFPNLIRELLELQRMVKDREYGYQHALLLTPELYSKMGDTLTMLQVQRALAYDYFILRSIPEPDELFINLTHKGVVENILREGMYPGDTDDVFGSGNYFYRYDEMTKEFLKTLDNPSGVIFRLHQPYGICVGDFAEGTHDGSCECPPYCYSTDVIGVNQIVSCVLDGEVKDIEPSSFGEVDGSTVLSRPDVEDSVSAIERKVLEGLSEALASGRL